LTGRSLREFLIFILSRYGFLGLSPAPPVLAFIHSDSFKGRKRRDWDRAIHGRGNHNGAVI